MWQAYLKVIAKRVPYALDRFHVMQKTIKAIDKVRAAEARQMKEDGYEPLVAAEAAGESERKSSGKAK